MKQDYRETINSSDFADSDLKFLKESTKKDKNFILSEGLSRLQESKKDEIITFLQTTESDSPSQTGYSSYVKWAVENGLEPASVPLFSNIKRAYASGAWGKGKTEGEINKKDMVVFSPPPEEPLYDPADAEVFEASLEQEAVRKFEFYEAQLRNMAHAHPELWALFVYGNPGLGKALANFEQVITNKGLKPISEIKEGDRVLHPSGSFTYVTKVHPQPDNLDLYKIYFSDGLSIVASGNHLWKVRNTKNPTEEKLLTTEELLKERVKLKDSGSHKYRWSIPGMNLPFQVPFSQVKKTFTDPYLLGYNGTYFGFENSYIDEEIYFWSVCDRARLLNGIVDKRGKTLKFRRQSVKIKNLSFSSALKLTKLVKSLGGVTEVLPQFSVKHVFKKEKLFKIIIEGLSINPFFKNFLQRKLYESKIHLKKNKFPLFKRIYITKIEPFGKGGSTCISVSAEDGLFVTKDFIVTHNSFYIKKILLKEEAEAVARNGMKVVIKSGSIAGFTGLLKVLYDYRKGYILVLDDNDNLLVGNIAAANILKAALQTEREERHITYSRADFSELFREEDEIASPEEKEIEDIEDIEDQEDMEEDELEEEIKESVSRSPSYIHIYEKNGTYIFEKASQKIPLKEEDLFHSSEENKPDSIKDFYFESRIIFVSNLMKVPPAVGDRCLKIPMVFTPEQVLNLIKQNMHTLNIKDKNGNPLSDDIKMEVYNFIRRNRLYLERTLGRPLMLTYRMFRNCCIVYEQAVNAGLSVSVAKQWVKGQLESDLGR